MSRVDSTEYDFIVVGGGPGGCAVAWRLANSAKRPKVLLIEAGGPNDQDKDRISGDRWINRMIPGFNWNYKTAPQQHLKDRIIDYDRGKGLGGSSSINFCGYTVGPAGDWDELARRSGSDDFAWKNASKAMKRIETYQIASLDLPDYAEKYLKPDMELHGSDGPLKIGFAKNWEWNIATMMDISQEAGLKLNSDMNSGDPVGVGITPSSVYRGLRSTAADLLVNAPSNLKILLDTEVLRLIHDHGVPQAKGLLRCVGVMTDSDNPAHKEIYASKEIIISSGSLDSPRILMHSGIGPRADLARFNIPTVVDLPNLGSTLQDHHHVLITWERKPHTTTRHTYYADPSQREIAFAQWQKDRTGPLTDLGTMSAICWLKSDAMISSPEFQTLPPDVQTHINHPTVPHHEIMFNIADTDYFLNDPKTTTTPPLFTAGVFVMNPQSQGSLRLQSSDPKTPLLFDPKYFSHPWDKRVAIEATRELLRIADEPSFQKDTVCLREGPKSNSEEDILDFFQTSNMSTWHMSSTIPMGPEGDSQRSLDGNLRVVGLENVRVIDLSAVPFVMNCHTQAVAYIVGVIGGDKIVKAWGLD